MRSAGFSTPPEPPQRLQPAESAADDDDGYVSFSKKLSALSKEPPETVLSAAVRMKGEMHFERLLWISGVFEGTLKSSGTLVVAPGGLVVGPVVGMKVVLVQGSIRGDVSADKVYVGPEGCVQGDVMARRVVCADGAVLAGQWNVHRQVPHPLQLTQTGKVVKYSADGQVEDDAAGASAADGGVGAGAGGPLAEED